MLYQDRSFEYPSSYIIERSVGIVFFFALILLGLYLLFAEDFFLEGWTGILLIVICFPILIAVGFERAHANTILVNEREIIALKKGRRLSIPWSSINRIYYTSSVGPAPERPYINFYIFGNKKDFIVIRHSIRNFSELLQIVEQHCQKKGVDYIPFMRLAGIFLRIYFGKGEGAKK